MALHSPKSNPSSLDLDPNSLIYKIRDVALESLFFPLWIIISPHQLHYSLIPTCYNMFCFKTKQKPPLTFNPSIFWANTKFQFWTRFHEKLACVLFFGHPVQSDLRFYRLSEANSLHYQTQKSIRTWTLKILYRISPDSRGKWWSKLSHPI